MDKDRDLPGIDWNVKEQLELLAQFDYNTELKEFGAESAADLTFHFKNGTFESGDAEFLYNLIRLKKPSRVFEIGSGNSTLVARKALLKNLEENPSREYRHLCIEPYKMPWLEKTGVSVVRQRVEDVDKKLFSELESGDLLFIDSSHVIRPQGDVLFEYLELIPSLRSGVIVHIHDVFSPKDYLKEFLVDQVRFWNEQYLLEAFLTCNKSWKIIGALNYLHHNYYDKLRTKCPYLTPEREPGSFYIVKVS